MSLNVGLFRYHVSQMAVERTSARLGDLVFSSPARKRKEKRRFQQTCYSTLPPLPQGLALRSRVLDDHDPETVCTEGRDRSEGATHDHRCGFGGGKYDKARFSV
jgi:hypothetical protein